MLLRKATVSFLGVNFPFLVTGSSLSDSDSDAESDLDPSKLLRSLSDTCVSMWSSSDSSTLTVFRARFLDLRGVPQLLEWEDSPPSVWATLGVGLSCIAHIGWGCIAHVHIGWGCIAHVDIGWSCIALIVCLACMAIEA